MAHRSALLSCVPCRRLGRTDGYVRGRDRRHLPAALSPMLRTSLYCRAGDGPGGDCHHSFLGSAAADDIPAAGHHSPRPAAPGRTTVSEAGTPAVVAAGAASVMGESAWRVSAGSGADGSHPRGLGAGGLVGADELAAGQGPLAPAGVSAGSMLVGDSPQPQRLGNLSLPLPDPAITHHDAIHRGVGLAQLSLRGFQTVAGPLAIDLAGGGGIAKAPLTNPDSAAFGYRLRGFELGTSCPYFCAGGSSHSRAEFARTGGEAEMVQPGSGNFAPTGETGVQPRADPGDGRLNANFEIGRAHV